MAFLPTTRSENISDSPGALLISTSVCYRPDSADGFLSPSRSSSRNGEKDWENGSTTSSVTSNTEYTGRTVTHAVPSIITRTVMSVRMGGGGLEAGYDFPQLDCLT